MHGSLAHRATLTFFLVAGLSLAGCEDSKSTSSPGAESAQPARPPFEVLEFDRAKLPPSLSGAITATELESSTGLRFRDANGDNVVFFSLTRMSSGGFDFYSLAVSHVAELGGAVRKVSRVVDKLDCKKTASVAFVPKAAAVTDLDSDGVGEFTFAYYKACDSWQLVAGAFEEGDGAKVSGTQASPEPKALGRKGPSKMKERAEAVWRVAFAASM